jgi:enoyl-CoA hydratase/carnithine racemase
MVDSALAVPGLVLSEPEPGIYELLIDRAERKNALTDEMMLGLSAVVDEVNGDENAAALIIRGAGGSFCAGADLSVVQARKGQDQPWRWPELMGREAELLDGCEIATISVVNGPAVGLGMGLAISCDICVAEPAGFFAEAHLALGLAPTAMSWWLPRMCGLQHARDVILTGRRVLAEEAAAIGLVARLVEPGEGITTARQIARDVARMPRDMARYAKLGIRLAQDQSRMQEVRRFGGMANRMHRSLLATQADAGA